MSSSRFKFDRKVRIFIDILLTISAFFMAYFVRNTFFGKMFGYLSPFSTYIWIIVMAAVVFPVFMSLFGINEIILEDKLIITIFKATISIFLSIICMSAILFLTKDKSLSRLLLGIFGCVEVAMIVLERIVLRGIKHLYLNKSVHKVNVLIVGCGNIGKLYYERIQEHNQSEINIIGFIALEGSQNNVVDNKLIVGTISDLERIVKQNDVSEVIIALTIEEYQNLKNVLSACDREGLRVSILPACLEFLQVNMRVENVFGIPVINLREVPLDLIENKFLKRAFDIIVSLFAILLLSPVYIIIALGVKLTSPGPVLFKQERVGIGNKPFMMLKFRSMCVQKEEEEKTKWTTPNDLRVTRFGSFIRKTSLDELPQFFNVLKGDMSIIGPRPERPYWVEKFKEEVPNYMLRHYIKTGITGWAQVNGFRGDTSIEERINCDNFYIHNWSMWMDIKIIFMTVIETIFRRNAY